MVGAEAAAGRSLAEPAPITRTSTVAGAPPGRTGTLRRCAMTSGSGRDQVVVGVDFGTLSGRAVVVRVATAPSSAARSTSTRTASSRTALPGTGRAAAARLGAAGARRTTSTCCGRRAEGGRGAAASPPLTSSASAPTSPRARCCRPLPTARRCASCRSCADRPHAYVKLWKHHAAQPQADRINALAHERGEPWIARYGGKLSSEWELAKGLQLLEEDPEVYARDRALGRGGRLDRLAAVRHVRPQRLHRRLQGASARTAAIRPRTSSPR